MPSRPLLFTAFEPSGDDHAAVVIAELRKRHSAAELPICAWGGHKMAEAGNMGKGGGVTIVERTGDNAVMGIPGPGKIVEHLRMNRRIGKWMDEHEPALVVPVDSPGANFPVCKLAKKRGIRVAHLVAPQVWAWATWRIKKLRRLTDMVLCLLPFEEEWFMARAVPARFIGHPLFEAPIDGAGLDRRAAALPQGSPKVALMPGSRPSEMRSCFPIQLEAFRRLRADFKQAVGVVAATKPQTAQSLRKLAEKSEGGWPEGLAIVHGDTDAVVRWCDYALTVSGTVTLQIARQGRPMVAMYRPSRLFVQLSRLLLKLDRFTLPNLIAGRDVIPERIPSFGPEGGEEMAIEVIRLMRQPGYAEDQQAGLAEVCRKFDGRRAGELAADAIEELLGLRPPSKRTASVLDIPAVLGGPSTSAVQPA